MPPHLHRTYNSELGPRNQSTGDSKGKSERHIAQKALFVHVHAALKKGRLTLICQSLLNEFQLILLLFLLSCYPPLLFCPGFQVIVALGSTGHTEEQGGVAAELRGKGSQRWRRGTRGQGPSPQPAAQGPGRGLLELQLSFIFYV